MTTVVHGSGSTCEIDPSGPACIIGERINPSGRSKLRQALLEHNWEMIKAEALSQVQSGADIIDVNTGGQGVDETELLPEAVRIISQTVPAPLSIDTRLPSALEAAIKACEGRPMINSIDGEQKILAENLPIVAEAGLPVIVLCIDDAGIPKSADERLKIAYRVLETAVKAGLKEGDIIFDPLVMTIGADDQAACMALETTRRLRIEFPNNNISGGASNVSFGMPQRPALNASFLTTAVAAGMNLPITDPTNPLLRSAVLTGDIFLGRDRYTRRYLHYLRDAQRSGK